MEPGDDGDRPAHATPAEALRAILGEPAREGSLAGSGGELAALLHYERHHELPGGARRDLFVTAGLSDALPSSYELKVELGIFRPPGDDGSLAAWLIDWIVNICTHPSMAGERQMVSPEHTIVGYFDEEPPPLPDAADLPGFHAVLFEYGRYIPSDRFPLRVSPPGGAGHDVWPLLVVPLTRAEWAWKRANGYEALVDRLNARFPHGEHLVAAPRPSAV